MTETRTEDPSQRLSFVLLGDQPHAADDDPLGFDRIAGDLCSLVLASRDSTPFTLGIEAGWGFGKSSLMASLLRQLGKRDGDKVKTVEFNAWAADDGKVLEGLLKTVLGAVDQRTLGETVRDGPYLRHVRLVTRLAARFLRIGDVVDLLWEQMSDPRTRNQLREILEKAMLRWRSDDSQRVLCVFVDDLDRCSPASVFDVFEAIKLYLDAQGLVFIIGYDPDVVSESILEEKRYSEAVTSRHYLEKIVQVIYRIPTAGDDETRSLIESYVTASGTGGLLDESARSLIIDFNARNPRRIKRLINGLILEYQRDREWADAHQRTLIREHLLHTYFPEFARLLSDRDRQRDPVAEFQEYVGLQRLLASGGPRDEEERELLERAAASYGVDEALPPLDLLSAIEKRLPESFPASPRTRSSRSCSKRSATRTNGNRCETSSSSALQVTGSSRSRIQLRAECWRRSPIPPGSSALRTGSQSTLGSPSKTSKPYWTLTHNSSGSHRSRIATVNLCSLHAPRCAPRAPSW